MQIFYLNCLWFSAEPKMPEGSWKCEKCNNINYPFRTKCNRQNCEAEKPTQSNSHGVTLNEDDQVCYCKHMYLHLSLLLGLSGHSCESKIQEMFSCILLQELSIPKKNLLVSLSTFSCMH